MRAFYLAWASGKPVPVGVGKNNRKRKSVADLDRRVLPQAVAEIPWGHNVTLLEKLNNANQRLWYAKQAIMNGWSRSMLEHWIESDLYSRQGKAVTNFETALPQAESDLARAVMRDPYNFDFWHFVNRRRSANSRRVYWPPAVLPHVILLPNAS
jgi:predicted nuclease of restriction endonuclease-like (RecB) superfamily